MSHRNFFDNDTPAEISETTTHPQKFLRPRLIGRNFWGKDPQKFLRRLERRPFLPQKFLTPLLPQKFLRTLINTAAEIFEILSAAEISEALTAAVISEPLTAAEIFETLSAAEIFETLPALQNIWGNDLTAEITKTIEPQKCLNTT